MKKISLIAAITAVMLLFAGCANENTVITVGSQKVSVPEFTFYLSSVKSQMAGTELTSDEDWQTKEIEGKKAIDLAKEKAVETAAANVAYIEVAKKLGITLSDEDKKNIASYKQRMMASYGSNDKYQQFLKDNNLSDEFVQMLCESMEYSDKLIQKIKNESPVTEDEMDEYFRTHYRRAKHVLILTKNMDTDTPYTPEKKEEAKKRADELYARALSGENFETLVADYSEDPGSKSNPDGYVFTDGMMVDEFTNGVDSVDVGGITMIESSFGYHIIKRYALDETAEFYQKSLAENKQTIERSILTERLTKQMEIWKSELGIEVKKNDTVYDSIK